MRLFSVGACLKLFLFSWLIGFILILIHLPESNQHPIHRDKSKKEILERLQYWLPSGEPKEATNRYLLFDTDGGAFNNIRIAFENYVILAWLSNRTLVLPRPRPWYLLDFGPQTRMITTNNETGITDYSDFWDIDDMRKALAVITLDEFFLRESKLLGFEETDVNSTWKWIKWKRDHWDYLSPAWDPYYHVIFWPNQSSVKPFQGWRTIVDNREIIEVPEDLKKSRYLNFDSNRGKGYRFLSQIANLVLYANRSNLHQQFRLIRDNMHFKKEIFEWAAIAISKLGMFNYTAYHIRRNDAIYIENFIPAELSYENTKSLLRHGETIYIATDELEDGFFDVFKKSHRVVMWRDLNLDPPRKWIGAIEQIICAAGRRYFGTKASTFSGYVFRLRGYFQAPYKNHLTMHTTKYTGNPETDPKLPYRYTAREYMMEFPEIWNSIQN